MPHRCILCGALGATCGRSTIGTVQPVDQRISGYRVAGNSLVPDLTQIQPLNMTDEETEEFAVIGAAYEQQRSRLRARSTTTMADGKAPYTSLSYVLCPDGITRKMAPDVAQQYVEMNEGSEIVKEGALPVTKEGDVLGASKATIGQMFDENGRQREDVQPMTTRTFMVSDRTREEVVTPAVGTTGGANTEVNTGTGSMTSSAVTAPRMQPPADNDTD